MFFNFSRTFSPTQFNLWLYVHLIKYSRSLSFKIFRNLCNCYEYHCKFKNVVVSPSECCSVLMVCFVIIFTDLKWTSKYEAHPVLLKLKLPDQKWSDPDGLSCLPDSGRSVRCSAIDPGLPASSDSDTGVLLPTGHISCSQSTIYSHLTWLWNSFYV